MKIERGVPIPAKRGHKKNELQQALRPMRRGDSAFFAGVDTRNLWQAGRIAFGSGKFTTRREKDGARIWKL